MSKISFFDGPNIEFMFDDLDSHNECRNDTDRHWDSVTVSVAYSADNDNLASDSDLDNDSEM